MTPTLSGRIQTRIFLLIVVGVPWTFIIGPALPDRPEGASLWDVYEVTLVSLGIVMVAGIAWEVLYHILQQFRWEKDWPTLFGLLTGIPEGIVTYFLLDNGIPKDYGDISVPLFVTYFATTWILVWLAANGPMRVPFIRWRFRGGRLV
jgi:hypothetical protein